uniref:Anaphase-promoting complex subunit 10 n=1 Tax=Panagrolaimus sp. JU765 TaxID=591449 RepID=A0AC34RMH7_9BILA
MDQSTQEQMNENASKWRDVLPKDASYRDISFEAAWSLSSCKAEGYGIQQLLSPRMDAYWQSDGPQPHIINIEFQKKTDICFVLLYLDIKVDESYTPNRIVIQKGSSLLDLTHCESKDYTDPSGWEAIDIRNKTTKQPARAFVLQIQILSNHQNGRDTHIRGVKIIGPGRGDVPPNDLDSFVDAAALSKRATDIMERRMFRISLNAYLHNTKKKTPQCAAQTKNQSNDNVKSSQLAPVSINSGIKTAVCPVEPRQKKSGANGSTNDGTPGEGEEKDSKDSQNSPTKIKKSKETLKKSQMPSTAKPVPDREDKIAKGVVVRRQSDYPEMNEILSDYSNSDSEGKKKGKSTERKTKHKTKHSKK